MGLQLWRYTGWEWHRRVVQGIQLLQWISEVGYPICRSETRLRLCA